MNKKELYNYPKTNRDESIIDEYKKNDGTIHKVIDPYRWLENPDSNQTKEWVKEQNKITQKVINEQETDVLVKEYMTRLDYPRYGGYRRRGDILFFDRNPGLLNQAQLFAVDINDKRSDQEREQLILDPNTYSQDGTWSLSSTSISSSGRFIAFGYSQGGSDWVNFKVLKVPKQLGQGGGSVEILDDHIEWSKFSHPTWTPNEDGFLYARFPTPASKQQTNSEDVSVGTETDTNEFQKLYYHRLGTKQSEDILVYESKEHANYMFSCEFTDDHKYLVVYTARDCNPEVNLSVITNFDSVINNKGGEESFNELKLITDFNASYSLVHSIDNVFYMHSNLNAPLSKLISLEFQPSSSIKINDIIPQKHCLSQWIVQSSNKFYASYLNDVQDMIQVFDIKGQYLYNIELPGPGCVYSFAPYPLHTHIYFTFQSFTFPSTIFYLNSLNDKVEIFKEPTIKNFDTNNYICKQLFYKSKDGTKIPMFVVHKKDYSPSSKGAVPTFLTGYGGFEITLTPYFSPQPIFFIDKFDGVYVQANIRGGGEYGKQWHKAGSLHNKQNVFDDFIGAAEFLIQEGYTRSDLLTINGGSNGGLLVGACANQRPDLFGCAIADVGVHDMLRFHRFTIGSHWCSDYGCADKPQDFEVIYAYSPLHNVNSDAVSKQQISYPSMLLLTGDHDDRVVPLHSYKYIAELQYRLSHLPSQTNPLLIMIDEKTGHGAGKPLRLRAKEFCSKLYFISQSIHYKI